VSDVDDFESFFTENYGSVVRALTLAFGSRDRAEDLSQEAFAQAFRRWKRVREMNEPVGWVYTVAVNRGSRNLRHDRRPVDVSVAVRTSDLPATIANTMVLETALARLAPRQRTAVVLRYFADLPVKDIADAMGCSMGTVKATIHSALKKLQVTLDAEEDTDAH
jgi:RNA polymerase sigma-70 factor (ECF subfamily)